jgi:hypothetical protein
MVKSPQPVQFQISVKKIRKSQRKKKKKEKSALDTFAIIGLVREPNWFPHSPCIFSG